MHSVLNHCSAVRFNQRNSGSLVQAAEARWQQPGQLAGDGAALSTSFLGTALVGTDRPQDPRLREHDVPTQRSGGLPAEGRYEGHRVTAAHLQRAGDPDSWGLAQGTPHLHLACHRQLTVWAPKTRVGPRPQTRPKMSQEQVCQVQDTVPVTCPAAPTGDDRAFRGLGLGPGGQSSYPLRKTTCPSPHDMLFRKPRWEAMQQRTHNPGHQQAALGGQPPGRLV